MVRVFLVLLLLLPGFAMAQETGEPADRGVLQAWLEDNLSGAGRTVRIRGFTGALSSRASFDELTIADDGGVWLTVRGAVLDWSRTALLSGNLQVNELSAEEIVLSRIPTTDPSTPSAETSPFVLPELPVTVDIGSLAVRKLTLGAPVLGQEAAFDLSGSAHLKQGDGTAALSLTRSDGPAAALEFSGGFSNTTRVLTLALEVSEDAGGIVGQLIGLPGTPAFALTLDGEGPLGDFASTLSLATGGQPRVTGSFRLTDREDPDAAGDWIRGFSAELGGDLRPLVDEQYHPFLGPRIDLKVSGDRFADGRMELSDFHLTADAIHLTGDLGTDASGWPRHARLKGVIEPTSGDEVTLFLPGIPTKVGRGTIDFSFDADRSNAWTLTAGLDRLVRPELELDRVTLNGSGSFDLEAKDVDGTLALDATGISVADPAMAAALGPAVSLTTDFDWASGAPLVLSDINLLASGDGLRGDAVLSGVETGIDVEITGNVSLRAADFSRYAGLAGLPLGGSGRLGIDGKIKPVSGSLDLDIAGRTMDLVTGIAQLDPLLNGPATLDVNVTRDDTGISLPRLRIESRRARIAASGTLATGDMRLDLDASLTDLADVLPGASGPAEISVNASQHGTAWEARAAATGPGGASLELAGNASVTEGVVGMVSGQATLSADDLSPYAQVTGYRLGGGLDIEASGSGNWSQLTGSLKTSGTTTSLTTGIPELDAILAGTGTFSAAVSRDAEGRLMIESLDARTPLVQASATGSAGADGTSSVDFSLDLANLGRLVEGFDGPARATGNISSSGKDWTLSTSLTAAGGAAARVSGTLAGDGSSADLAATGIVPLGLLNRFISPNRTEGTANFDLRLNGPMSLTALTGRIAIGETRVTAPTARLGLKTLEGAIDLGGGVATLDLKGQATDGGKITLTGSTGIVAPYTADMEFLLTGVKLINPGLYQTTVSGKASIKGPLTGVAVIAGDVTLGETELRISEIPASAASPVVGLSHVGEPASSYMTRERAGLVQAAGKGGDGSPSRPYGLDIKVSAPNRVFVRGRGLDAELGGELRLRGTTSAVVTQGGFDLVRGRFDFLGKRLTLTETVIRAQGDFDPYIRAVATTQSGETEITVRLEGLASSPEITFSSSPSLPQDEIVSLILFDKGIAEVSPLQALKIASALRTLAGKGGSFTDTVRGRVGLDDLDVTTNTAGATEVTAGKYLNENIYSDVTVDSEGQSTINLNLSLTPHITTRGSVTSQGESSVGVFFERDY